MLLVIVAIAAAGFLAARAFGWLRPYVLLRTYTDDAGGLSVGSTVRVNGIWAGYLDKLVLTGSRDRARKVELDMRIKPSMVPDIPVDSTAGITASSIAGDYYINIVEGSSSRHVQAGDELASRLPADTSEMMAKMQTILQQFDQLVARANNLLESVQEGHGTIGKWMTGQNQFAPMQTRLQALQNDISHGQGTLPLLLNGDLASQVQSTEDRYHQVMARFQAGQGTAAKLTPLFADASNTMKQMNGLIAEMNSSSGPSARVKAISQEFDRLTQKVNDTFGKIQSGVGTLGQFEVNPQFSDALAKTNRELQAMTADLRKNPRKFLSFRFRLF